jgi:hypothetical protein
MFAALLVPFLSSCQRADRNLESESIKPRQDLESDQLLVVDIDDLDPLVEFEGFINYGTPIEVSATTALGAPTTVVLTD